MSKKKYKSNAEFLTPVLTTRDLHHYIIRLSILKAVKEVLPQFKNTLLDIGCGQMPYKSILLSNQSKVEKYIGLDLDGCKYAQDNNPDLLWNGQIIPLEDQSIDCAIATEVFEHCSDPQAVMKEIYRILKPDGFLFFTVPFLWNLHDVPFDEYRYTPFSLKRHFENAGFIDIQINALGGWDASMGQMLGLWVRRRFAGMDIEKRLVRFILSLLLIPIIWFLYKIDKPPKVFLEGTMMTGFWGIVKKSRSTSRTRA